MTPSEHYREAERLLRLAEQQGNDAYTVQIALIVQYAQVHATLATARREDLP